MTTRMSGRRAAMRVALFAAAAVAVAAVGNGWALQPAGKGKEPPKAAPVHPAAAAAQDEYDLLVAQAKLKQTAADAADRRVKMAEGQMKRLESAGAGIGASDLAVQKGVVEAAKAEAEVRTAELGEHRVKVDIAKRRLTAVADNPPKAGGPSPTEESLAKLVQLLAERNTAEKDWMAKETLRLADDARRQAAALEDQRVHRVQEGKAREEELKEARKQAAVAEQRAKDGEAAARDEMKRRLDAEAERVRQEKSNVLKRLPGEVADTELRLRAAELKREQSKLELDAVAREIDRLKAVKADLAELKATLEKELKAKNDK